MGKRLGGRALTSKARWGTSYINKFNLVHEAGALLIVTLINHGLQVTRSTRYAIKSVLMAPARKYPRPNDQKPRGAKYLA